MAHYFEAKRRLFEMLPEGAPAIVNVDDPYGVELSRSRPHVLTYAIDKAADLRATNIHSSLEGLAFELHTPQGVMAMRSPLVGRPNVYNILGVVGAAIGLGLPTSAIEDGIARLEHVPGRFQNVSSTTDDVRVVVDYAHTDDALKNLLETARPLAPGRLITVFGCGGDRDRTKRPLMGAVAARLSDLVVVTSDNPRSEDPSRIIDEITRGIVLPVSPGAPKRPATPLITQVDRRVAIEQAIRAARPGHKVLNPGKAHEKYQVIGDRTLPFDDVEVARAALGQRATRRVARVIATVGTVTLSSGMVAQATGGRLASGPVDHAWTEVSIDSRTLRAGALFVAIRGDRFDGHAFVADAVGRGATGLLVAEPVPPLPGVSK